MHKICLKCKYYIIRDAESGLCRVENLAGGKRDAPKARVLADGCCQRWLDCGQTYFIRLGWIKNNAGNSSEQEQ